MIRVLSYFLAISFLFPGIMLPQKLEMKSATVAGFINRGKSSKDNINLLMGRSLTTFLMKISKSITPFRDVQDSAGASGFWGQKELNSSQAINIAQQFSTEQVITGDYLVNDQKDTITINVYVYNVVNGELLFKRNYKGDAGPEIFETIDKMILDISGLLVGKTISIGYFKLDVKPDKTKYRLFINDSFVKLVGSGDGYFDKFISGQSIDISLKPEKSDDEALRKIIEIKSGKTNELVYNPSGVLIVEAMESGIDVYLNGAKIGKTDSSGEFIIQGIEAGKDNGITLKNGNSFLSGTNINIREGSTKVVVFKTSPVPVVDYKQSEEIEIQGDNPNGTKYIAGTSGFYRFSIVRGWYRRNLNGILPPSTAIAVYTNRNIIWSGESWGQPKNFDYYLGSKKAGTNGNQSFTVNLKKDDYVIFIAQNGYGDFNRFEGKIYLSVTHE